VTRHFRTTDGLRLAYDDRGAGRPLLCLAGLTRNMADFEPVLPALDGAARVIRLDSRGRGRSDRAPDHRSYSLAQEAVDAIALLDHLEIPRASVLGTSRGGLIAMTLAASHPDRLAGAILNDIGPVVEPAGLAAIMGHLGRRPPYASYAEAAARLPEDMAPAFRNVPPAAWRAHAERLWIETPEGLDLRYDPALRTAVEAQSATGPAPDLWPLFEALAARPLALIRGANSDLLSAATAAEMRRRAPEMIVAEVPDRGHVPFLDEPAALAAIRAWLARAP
jgi:pimeloyl-ACP methyl ester carboxylesterase